MAELEAVDTAGIPEVVEAGNSELMLELGPILATIHAMPSTHRDRPVLIRTARSILHDEFGADGDLVLSAVNAGLEYVLTELAFPASRIYDHHRERCGEGVR